MGLLEKYLNDGSDYDKPNPVVNLGATQQSQLHGFGVEPGFSVGNSAAKAQTIAALNAYDDGVNNLPPSPSVLDLSFNGPINAPQ